MNFKQDKTKKFMPRRYIRTYLLKTKEKEKNLKSSKIEKLPMSMGFSSVTMEPEIRTAFFKLWK